MLLKCCIHYANKVGKFIRPQNWKRSVFIPIPKEGQCQRMFKLLHNCTHFICQQGHTQNPPRQALQQYVNREFLDVQTGFRKSRGTTGQIANIPCIIEKARDFKKSIYFCFIDCVKDFDCVDHKQLCKIFQEMGIPNHLTCLLRNLYAGQEATVRTVLKFDRKQ